MASNLYQQLQNQSLRNNPQIQSIRNMIGAMRGMSNPAQMLSTMAQNNPQMQEVINIVNNSGKSPKEICYQMAQQRGIDPEQLVSAIMS